MHFAVKHGQIACQQRGVAPEAYHLPHPQATDQTGEQTEDLVFPPVQQVCLSHLHGTGAARLPVADDVHNEVEHERRVYPEPPFVPETDGMF